MPWNRDAFLKNWRDALKEAGRQTGFTHEGWQGPIAYQQLKNLGLLDVVFFDPGSSFAAWRVGWVLRELAAVVDTYEDGARRVERQKELLLTRVEPLRSAEKSLRKLLVRPVPAKLERSIRTTRKLLKREISERVAEIEDRVWNFELMLWRP